MKTKTEIEWLIQELMEEIRKNKEVEELEDREEVLEQLKKENMLHRRAIEALTWAKS